MTRFTIHPKWLVYLPPTMSPPATTARDGLLEHPDEAFAYYRAGGVATVLCEEKHMGSRAVVVACRDEDAARRLQAACHTGYFRPYTNTDVVGCELGGAVKNVIGLAVGIADGMGLGDNTKGSLITRGLAETTRLGAALGADPLTFSGLAGLGDLVATCSSPLSRNHSFGTHLGRGMTVAEAVAATRQTAEGVKSCESVAELARRHGVDMPITETVVDIVHNGKQPIVAVKELMSRSAKAER
jgi:glycerol-3-phosphate dehydrogenase (NAD(P)+)